jgi:hypothetical protein
MVLIRSALTLDGLDAGEKAKIQTPESTTLLKLHAWHPRPKVNYATTNFLLFNFLFFFFFFWWEGGFK